MRKQKRSDMLTKTSYIRCMTAYQIIALFRTVIDSDLTYILKRDRITIIFSRDLASDEVAFCTKMKEQFPLEFSIA